jgi:hypothetical protein
MEWNGWQLLSDLGWKGERGILLKVVLWLMAVKSDSW